MAHTAYSDTSCFFLPITDSNNNTDSRDSLHPKVRNIHVRYLNSMDQKNMAAHFMPPGAGRTPYAFIRGKDADETVEIAASLGLSEFHVEKAKNRIFVDGHVLAFLPMEEYKLRIKERKQRADSARSSYHNDVKDRMSEIPGVKGVTIQHGDFMERKEHGGRPGKPFVALGNKWDAADD